MKADFLTTDFTDCPDLETRVIREIRGFLPTISEGPNRHG